MIDGPHIFGFSPVALCISLTSALASARLVWSATAAMNAATLTLVAFVLFSAIRRALPSLLAHTTIAITPAGCKPQKMGQANPMPAAKLSCSSPAKRRHLCPRPTENFRPLGLHSGFDKCVRPDLVAGISRMCAVRHYSGRQRAIRLQESRTDIEISNGRIAGEALRQQAVGALNRRAQRVARLLTTRQDRHKNNVARRRTFVHLTADRFDAIHDLWRSIRARILRSGKIVGADRKDHPLRDQPFKFALTQQP